MTTTFDEEMRAALAAGQPNLDNVGDGTTDGPDICRDACALAGTEHTEDQCAGLPLASAHQQECGRCGDAVHTVSSRGWCDGCEAEDDAARTCRTCLRMVAHPDDLDRRGVCDPCFEAANPHIDWRTTL